MPPLPAPDAFGRYVGLPFRDKGRDVTGVDCWGLLRLLYAELAGIDLPSYATQYGPLSAAPDPGLAALIRAELPAWSLVPAGQERALDGVALSMGDGETHIGIVVTPGYFLHARLGADTVVERYHAAAWRRRVSGFYRHAALA